ncbi:MAG: 3-oxoacyl-ACP synthase [Cytophagales bacterium]|nr:3-oxoacyl-ACP synthase [Cytophagales bacterium]
MEGLALKKALLDHCKEVVDEKFHNLIALDKAAQSSANNETKSSAGDKYETGRAMMHLEKERLASQMNEVAKLKKPLEMINPDKESPSVELGSIVHTEDRNYFISVSLGEITVADQIFFCISPVTPIGTLMQGKQTGETFQFAGEAVIIQQVI